MPLTQIRLLPGPVQAILDSLQTFILLQLSYNYVKWTHERSDSTYYVKQTVRFNAAWTNLLIYVFIPARFLSLGSSFNIELSRES